MSKSVILNHPSPSIYMCRSMYGPDLAEYAASLFQIQLCLNVNLKSKVVLAKIPGHFLVAWDRRPNILHARLRRNCSWLKYDLFRSNIITDSRCVCGFIREDACHFLLNSRLYINISNRGQLSLIFCITMILGVILEFYYLETLEKTRLNFKIFCYQR